MFYCNDCRIKNDWVESFNESYGKCEVCGKIDVCNDVLSSQLPPTPKIIDVKTGLEQPKNQHLTK